jgi:hypothetical protein
VVRSSAASDVYKRQICNLLNLSQKTLRKGLHEVNNPLENAALDPNRQRKPGGGRKVFF